MTWDRPSRTRRSVLANLDHDEVPVHVSVRAMAGIADTRADAIRWALARIREQPVYERLRERIQEVDQLGNEF